MAKYKVLKSVAHNTGHSLLGATNWYADAFPFHHITRTMQGAGVAQARVNLLTGAVSPATIAKLEVAQFGELGQIVLRNLLLAEGWSTAQMTRAEFFLDLEAHECRVEIEDDRGKLHVGNVVDWGFRWPAS